MANTMLIKKLACLAMVCMVVQTFTTTPTVVEAAVTTCGMVSKSLAPCMGYLKGTGGAPPANCCAGVRSLKGAAQTTADRRFACNCMKSAATKMKILNYKLANGLANQCGVRVGYSFNPNIDCNSVQ